MKNQAVAPELESDLQKIYSARFSGNEEYRNQVWQILVTDFFAKWIAPNSSIIDLGCGYGEFIRNVSAREKFAMDLNPTARRVLPPEVSLLRQDCSARWQLLDESLDVVFTSNFFEHLPDKPALQRTLSEAYRCLRHGGKLIALGPNIAHLHGRYWDFFDHHLPLSDVSLAEALSFAGFKIELRRGKFLPYTMSSGTRRAPVWAVKLYLKLPFAWKVFGRQFLVVGKK